MGRMDSPSGLREYSTRGGTSGYTLRVTRPSSSIERRLSVSTFWLIPSRFFCSSLKRQGRASRFRRINSFHLLPISCTVVATGQAGANVFAFARYCPTSEEKDVGIAPQRYRRLLADCDKKFKAYEAAGCQTYFNKKDHLWTLYEYETGAFKIPEGVEEGVIYGGCNCGNCHLTILPTGDIYACRRVQNSRVGNVFEDRLADVWVCQMEAYREYSKFEKCSKCELLAFCRGCPAVASGKDGNFYAADPQCWKEVTP